MTIKMSSWQYPTDFPQLLSGQVHLWRFSLDALPVTYENLRALLSADELARADRLLDPLKCHNFTIARGHLRRLLANYLDLAPEEIDFSYNVSGKPFVATKNSSGLTFNLSHSGSRAILAVAMNAEVGVDIEKVDFDLNFHLLAARYFSPMEFVALKGFSTIRQRRQFYRIWTCKEAVLKMIGSGFSSPEPVGTVSQNCCVINTFFAVNYVSAVVIDRKITAILKFNLSPDEGISPR
ncbi:MAG: 4'-phosphopantetheinyl transferase superfamily protein [Desulfuromusa sp.]|nr:4'-phosphopantetheinyl transferase superfamily protein [Desulfuromusa sp.]